LHCFDLLIFSKLQRKSQFAKVLQKSKFAKKIANIAGKQEKKPGNCNTNQISKLQIKMKNAMKLQSNCKLRKKSTCSQMKNYFR